MGRCWLPVRLTEQLVCGKNKVGGVCVCVCVCVGGCCVCVCMCVCVGGCCVCVCVCVYVCVRAL